MQVPGNSWVEQLYTYVESYYWVPQTLNMKVIKPDSFKEVKQKIRKQEVPLNGVFNIGLRLLPTKIVQGILGCFTEDERVLLGNRFDLGDFYELTGKEGEFCQPDVMLENAFARVFIELKVDAHLTLQQAHKYLFALALWNQKNPQHKKTPYLLFLTKKNLDKQWASGESKVIFQESGEAKALLEHLKNTALPDRSGGKSVVYLHEEAKRVLDDLVIGSCTWEQLGHYLHKEYSSMTEKSEALVGSDETVGRLIADMLAELQNRKLWVR